MEEILQILSLKAFAYDNTPIIPDGTVLQSYDPDDILIITDGFETFIGVVADVIYNEDDKGNQYIPYQVKLVKYIPPSDTFRLDFLASEGEDTWDDDWERGYEKYNPACNVGGSSSGEIGGTQLYNNYNMYQPGSSYHDVNVYRHEYIEGAEYDPRYGYLLPEGIRHTIPYDITGYTVVINTEVQDHISLTTRYSGKGTQMVGAFGEEIPPDPWGDDWSGVHPVLRVNSTNFEFGRAGVGGSGSMVQSVWINNLNSDKLVLSVDKTSESGIFTVAAIAIPTGANDELGGSSGEVIPAVSSSCVTKAGGSSTQPNMIKVYRSGGGAWKTTGASIGAGMGPISDVSIANTYYSSKTGGRL